MRSQSLHFPRRAAASFNKLIEPPKRSLKVGRIRCRNKLGGMLNYYYREAA
jgi:hypothetical protein